MTCLPGEWCSGVRSVSAQASDDQKMLGLLAKKKKKVVSIKCEPLNGVKWATHTDNATLDHCFSFFPKCCGFHLSSFPDWTTKDRDVVCIYRVRAYTKPGCGRMQLLAFFYQIMRFSLLWNKPEVFLKKNKKLNIALASFIIPCLQSHKLVSAHNVSFPGNHRYWDRYVTGFQCMQVRDRGSRLKAGVALCRVIPFQVHPRRKNHSWVGSAVDCLSAKTDHRWNYFRCCVRIWRMF